MYCENCGAALSEGALFCESCGSKVAARQPAPEAPKPNDTVIPPRPAQNEPPFVYAEPVQQNGYAQSAQRPKANLSFVEAIKEFFSRYADFAGRSVRSAYWWPVLLNVIISSGLGQFSHLKWIASLYALAALIPGIAVCVRRLHDVGYSAKYLLMLLIPIYGWIWMIVQMCKESTGDNQWGLAPDISVNPQ